MADPPRSLSPAQQAQFAQEKLRQIYLETCVWLSPHKDFLHLIQEIILWRKIAVSAGIVCLVELLLWQLYISDKTYVTTISDVVFWWLLADVFWVVATRDRRQANQGTTTSKRSGWLRTKQKQMKYLSLEEAIMKDAEELEIGKSAPFEVMCLWIAKLIMLIDNIQLALRHWSQEQPYLFSVVTGVFGLVCVLIGYWFSGVFLMLIFANYLMFYPAFKYYGILDQLKAFIDTHYPALAERVNHYYQYIKGLLTPLAEQEYSGIHLDPTEPMNDDLPADTRSQGDKPPVDSVDNPLPSIPEEPRNRTPTLSLAPFNQDPLESMAAFIPPSEGFPSITAFFNENSISLPSLQDQQRARVGVASGSRRAPNPQDTLSLDPFESLDPMHDSFDDDLLKPIPTGTEPSAPPLPTPNDPPPPYEPSPYFRHTASPLISGLKAQPKDTSTPSTDEGHTVRKRDVN